ncbi:uncharacterized protein LOC113554117 [Rhopalosiphum maidis]|uniref:uncharacterized protein LOC113554117 n=1 Tax=Rhopalosiphum maidis TaxID=43146 RepID=UPI000F00B0D1|nr:uncharacterized protein LOC113554117 [Rhopalosiphum maidis]
MYINDFSFTLYYCAVVILFKSIFAMEKDNQNEVTPVKKNRCGKVVQLEQKKKIIYLYMDLKQKEPDIKYIDLKDKLSERSGIGIKTIMKTLSEYKSSGTISLPINNKKRLTVIEKVDDYSKNKIRKKIHEFWFSKKIPSLRKIIQVVKNDPDLPNISRTSFQRLLKDMQFEYSKTSSINSALIERDDLVLCRRKYISTLRRYRQEGRTIYYLGETWVNVKDRSSKVWVDKSVKSNNNKFLRGWTTGSRNPRCKRFIVVHIGSFEGFVADGLLCFESNENTVDNHNEINCNTFFEWFCSILPLLKDDAVIVMDNTPYNSMKKEQAPIISWKKNAILEWLESKGVVITEPGMVKFELLQKVQQIKQQYERLVVDEEAKKFNKIVLRLPQYHNELNPINSALSLVKSHVKENNTTYNLNDFRKLLNDSIKRVTPEKWSDCISHTLKEEDTFWQVDFISDKILRN